MANQTIGTTAWESVTTTTADTVFQNQSVNPMYLTTEATGALTFDQGFYLAPNDAIVIAAGQDVSAVAYRSDSELFYMAV
jgi:hypothetical protein